MSTATITNHEIDYLIRGEEMQCVEIELDPNETDEAVQQGLEGSAWTRQGYSIVLELELDDFASAMAFANSVAALAEAANHHPDILIHGWNKLRLTLSTHSADGLTQSDLDLARGIDGLSASGRAG